MPHGTVIAGVGTGGIAIVGIWTVGAGGTGGGGTGAAGTTGAVGSGGEEGGAAVGVGSLGVARAGFGSAGAGIAARSPSGGGPVMRLLSVGANRPRAIGAAARTGRLGSRAMTRFRAATAVGEVRRITGVPLEPSSARPRGDRPVDTDHRGDRVDRRDGNCGEAGQPGPLPRARPRGLQTIVLCDLAAHS
jgi:hypothetical protein